MFVCVYVILNLNEWMNENEEYSRYNDDGRLIDWLIDGF